jgi:tetratricopeptide (TPR) repeat protein
VVGAGEYPERRAYVDKAHILDRLQRPLDAAAARADAATRYALSDEMPRAVELFERACTLAPESASIRWDYADALRAVAEDDDTVVDVDSARRAYELVREGIALQPPGETYSWVAATEAMLAFTLDDGRADPALLLERSLLLGESAPVYAALAAVLRLSGYPTEAEGPARRCVELSPLDAFATDALAAVLADRGEYEQALAVLTSFAGLRSGSPLPLRAGAIHLCRGDPRAAIEAVADEEPSDTVLLIRGAANELAGEQDVALEEYELVRAGEGSLRDRAWAAYRTGSPDDAVDLLTELAAEQPRDRSFTLDLGVMLIAQGNVEQGDAALRDAIERCTVVGELAFLAEVDLRALRRDDADGPLSAVLDGIADHVQRRCATLRAATRPSDSTAVRAARARVALGDGDLDEALDRYRELLVEDEIAEAESGLARAAAALMKRGDSLLAEDRDAARVAWGRALIHASPPLTDTAPVLGHLRARIALVNLEVGERVELDALERAVGDTGGDAAAVVARDVPSVWRLRDAVARMAAGQPSAEIRARLAEVLDRIPLAPAYRLAQKEVPEAAVLPLITPLELRLPPELQHLIGAQEFDIPELRRRLAAQTGVRIPGVRVVAHPAGTERGDDVTFRVYDQVVHRLSGPDRPDDAAGLLEAFERVVRTRLYRTLVPADVPLWLDGWDDDAIRPVDGGLLDAASRLRMVRVLRMLLREEVPITDRSAIVAGFRTAEDLGSAGPWRTLEIVRGRLPVDALRGGRTNLAAMPEDLERRICSALDADRSSWAMEATVATELLADLRDWRTTVPDDVAVTVQDPDVRPFVWRLLASAALRGPVLTGEEVR